MNVAGRMGPFACAVALSFGCGGDHRRVSAEPAETSTAAAAGVAGTSDAGARSGGEGGASTPAAEGAAGGGATPPFEAGTVDPPGGVMALFPPPDSQGLCVDPALRLSFNGTPRIGGSGKIVVANASGGAVVTIDVAATRFPDTIGGTSFNRTRPVEVEGDTVAIALPSRGLEYGEKYSVTVENGAILGPSGAIEIGAGVWTFATRASAPGPKGRLKVAQDGSGDYCSVQTAIDALGAGGTEQRVIEIGRGTYYGIIHFARKNNLKLRGEDRKATILRGTNNEELNGGTANRALFGVDDVQDLIIENLTIHNLTPQGGSQAEALRLSRCERCSVRDADILSLQDTLLWSGRVYARNCYIEGNVDYIWGTGAAYFDQCEIKTVGRSGYNVQARNSANTYGYVFVKSRLTSTPGVTGTTLARIDASAYPASHVAYIDCELGPHISPAGWTITGGSSSGVRFWEYKSVTPAGSPVDIGRRVAGSRQIDDADAAMMRDPSVVLGGWRPPP